MWFYPFKAFQNCEVAFVTNGSVTWGQSIAKKFTATPEACITEYAAPGLSVVQTTFAPIDKPGVLMTFKVKSETTCAVVVRLEQALCLMWPANGTELGAKLEQDKETGVWTLSSGNGKLTAVAGWAGGKSASALPKDVEREGSVAVAGPELRDGVCTFVIAGGQQSLDETKGVWRNLAAAPDRFLKSAADYYRDLDTKTLSVTTPDAGINEAIRWAKIGLDKCYQITPGLGAGFVAGFNLCKGDGRPGFGWYFGRDSSWTQLAFNSMGEFEKSRENLELLAKYQIPDGENKGKIYHELSAAHEFIPQQNRKYAYPAGDSTPLYVIDMADYMRWTGDTKFVKANWKRVLDAMDWCYRMDVDGDGLMDNPPAGHEWYDQGKKNMIDLVAIWQRALESAAKMGKVLGDANVAKWERDARKVRCALDTDFWDDSHGYLYDRKLPDGSMHTITTGNPALPLLWKQIGEGKAQRAIDRLIKPDLTVPWGLRTNSNLDPNYRPGGYHDGRVWPLITGWASLACFNNHRVQEGLAYLKANTDLTSDFALGYITETLDGDQRSRGGCPHQAWSEAMVLLPMVEGILGIRVDAVRKQITFAPHVPAEWDHVSVKNLIVADNAFEIAYERKGGRVSVVIKQTRGKDSYTAVVSPAFPKSTERVTASADGAPTPAALELTPADAHATVNAAIGRKVVVELVGG